MPRVLLVSYYAPPRAGVATTRTRQLLRYLPSAGWDVTIATALLEGAEPDIVQTPYIDASDTLKRLIGLKGASAHAQLGIEPPARGVKRTLKQAAVAWGYRLTSYPDAQIGWLRARGTIDRLVQSGRFEVVLSSSPPFTTDLMLASLRLPIPWVADYRDLWSESNYYSTQARKTADAVLERWTLRKVSALTTISEPMASILRSHRRSLDVDVVPNAFDPQEWDGIPFEVEPRCTIVYAGQLFGGRRDPRPLFAAARSLIDAQLVEEEELAFHFYSKAEPWLTECIADYGLGKNVRVFGHVDRETVMRAERRADRLLVLLWEGGNTEGILTGKLFEYLGARRRILGVGGPIHSAVDELLSATDSGERYRDVPAIARALHAAVQQHRSGEIARIDEAAIVSYTAPEMARRMAMILDRVTNRRVQEHRLSNVPS